MTPEQEEQVRRALRAAAQADAPGRMPPEVVDRLDRVLADLSGTTGSTHPAEQPKQHEHHVDELAARRRRWAGGLVAAAAVALIALGGVAVGTRGFGSFGGGSSTTSAEHGQQSAAAGSASPQASSTGGQRSLRSGPAGSPVVGDLHRSTLGRDVRRLLLSRQALNGAKAPRATQAVPAECAHPFTGAGSSLFVVRLDDRPATLVVGPVRNGVRQARVYSCQGAGSPLASVSVPVR